MAFFLSRSLFALQVCSILFYPNQVAAFAPGDHELARRLAESWPPVQVFHPEMIEDTAIALASVETVVPTEVDSVFDHDQLDKRQSKLRVMIVGDSMSQGQQGDFTWRYRIWQWFQSNNIAVDFVGPYRGTVAPPPSNPGPPTPPRLASQGQAPTSLGSFSGGYAAGVSFDSDHYAAWGRAVASDKAWIYGNLTAPGNMADMMLVMLGFNDMGWFYSDAPGTLDSMSTFVSEARRANPNMKFAIANVPQRSFIGGRQDLIDNTAKYNGLLANAIPQWSTAQSPISLVHLQENYDCSPNSCPAGYDGLHPGELGEYQIARAFSLSLNSDFKLGSGPLAIPANIPPRAATQAVPANFKVFTSPQGVSATWDPVYGAYGYDVQTTITAADGSVISQNWSPASVTSNRWDSHWSLDGWTYTLQIRTRAGDTRVGSWTSSMGAVAHPQLAPAPNNVVVHPTATGVDISWDPPTGPYTDSIIEYNIIYFDIDSCEYLSGAAFKSSPAHIDGFKPGHHQFLAIVTWNANGEGFPMSLNQVRAGSLTPPTPGKPTVDVFDPTSVHITWNEVAGAAGYAIWARNVNDPKSISTRLNGTSPVACINTYFLFPGAWNYEFCVSAYNGNYESPKGPCAVGPSVTTSRPAPTCPPGPQWCSGGTSSGSAAPPPSTGSGSTGTEKGTSPSQSNLPSTTNDPNIQNNYPNADWAQFDCSSPGVIDANQDPSYRWTSVKTDSAWTTVNNAWKNTSRINTYSAYVSNFFHGNPSMACQTTAVQNACSMDIQCNEPTKPGGYHIINSMINSAIVLADVHQSIANARGAVALSADAFSTTFATYDGTQEKIFAVLLDLISFGYGAALTPVWAYILKQGAWGLAHKAAADVVKDETNNFVTSIIRTGKNYIPSSDQTSISTKLKDFAGTVLDEWANMVTQYQAYLFSGKDEAIADLYKLIRDGKMLDISGSLQTDDSVSHSIRRILWAKLLPVAWSLGTAHQFAVVINSGAACGTQNPIHGEVDDDVAAANYACVDNTIYYLLGGPIGTPTHCATSAHSQPVCTKTKFNALNGVGALTANNKDWEGITVQQLITGAVHTYKAAGNKNGAGEPDATDPSLIGSLYDQDITAPGVVTIPVCSVSEARNNWGKGSSNNFPCN